MVEQCVFIEFEKPMYYSYVVFLNFYKLVILGQPNGNDCTSMLISGGKWQTSDCTVPKSFVCEVFEETYSTQPQCRDGYSYYAEWNSCYKVIIGLLYAILVLVSFRGYAHFSAHLRFFRTGKFFTKNDPYRSNFMRGIDCAHSRSMKMFP
jgi:hypothetical protein